MPTNPIQYTSRTFQTVLNDINADALLIDKPDWFKRMVAGIMDVLSVIENAQANQSFLRTAFTRRAVTDLAALIDYNPPGQTESSGIIGFDLDPLVAPPYTILRANLAALSSGGSVPLRFEARSNQAVTSFTAEVTAAAAWNTSTEQILVASVFTTGERVRVTTSGTLPSPFSAGTDYYAIYVDDTHIKLALSRVDAFAGSNIDITAAGTGNHTLTRYTLFATLYQSQYVALHSIGSSDGSTPWQVVPIGQIGVVRDTLVIVINSITWTRVDTLVNSSPSDTHFRLYYNTDGTCSLLFGDGSYGAIPPAFDINAEYSYGGGAVSNVATLNSITSYAGSDTHVQAVFNPTAFTGGADAQNIEVTKRVAPLLLKTRDRFVTTEDGEALALGYGGLGQVKVNPNVWGPLSAQVLGVASGGGAPGSTLRTNIESYLVDRSVLESMDIRFEAGTFTPTAVVSAAKLKRGYTWSVVQPYFTLAWRLFLADAGREIADTYLSYGISSAVTLINTLFSTSFAAADYNAVSKLLDNIEPRNFGDVIQQSDAFAFCQGQVAGIDYMTITTPASWPLTLADDEITQVGTLTLTEIP